MLIESLLEANMRGNPAGTDAAEGARLERLTLTHHLFGFTATTRCTCSGCGHRTHRHERQATLELQVVKPGEEASAAPPPQSTFAWAKGAVARAAGFGSAAANANAPPPTTVEQLLEEYTEAEARAPLSGPHARAPAPSRKAWRIPRRLTPRLPRRRTGARRLSVRRLQAGLEGGSACQGRRRDERRRRRGADGAGAQAAPRRRAAARAHPHAQAVHHRPVRQDLAADRLRRDARPLRALCAAPHAACPHTRCTHARQVSKWQSSFGRMCCCLRWMPARVMASLRSRGSTLKVPASL